MEETGFSGQSCLSACGLEEIVARVERGVDVLGPGLSQRATDGITQPVLDGLCGLMKFNRRKRSKQRHGPEAKRPLWVARSRSPNREPA